MATVATSAFAIQEVDPNNSCATAQVLGAFAPNNPITVNGALKTPPSVPDIDYYKITGGTPGDILRVLLTGASDGVDTLIFPMVALLSSSCSVIQNSGASDPAKLEFTMPSDGIVVLAVTSCCDFALTGTGNYAGSYSLNATDIVPVSSISGRAVDAVTGQPASSVQTSLVLCGDPTCTAGQNFLVNEFVFTNGFGQYTFINTLYGAPLDPGTYQVSVGDLSGRYLPAESAPFSAASGQQVIVPDIALTPTPVINSITGRIVGSVTHAPLSGVSAPHAFVTLYGCEGAACTLITGYVDDSGRFKFTHDSSGHGIVANALFLMQVSADQYSGLSTTVGPFAAGANQDLGDIPLVSNPVRFTLLQDCSNVPISGGVCEYKVEITNGTAKSVEGEAWATISALGLQSFNDFSLFQTNEPEEMELASATNTQRASRVASFEFAVPGTVPLNAVICPTFWFGVDPVNPQLYVQGGITEYGSCVQRTATGYTPATREQADELRKEAHEHEAKERAAVRPH